MDTTKTTQQPKTLEEVNDFLLKVLFELKPEPMSLKYAATAANIAGKNMNHVRTHMTYAAAKGEVYNSSFMKTRLAPGKAKKR